MTTQPLRGLFAAVLTPVQDDGALDLQLLSNHASKLLERGCDGVSLFGTTGEGPAFTTDEREKGLEAVLAAGVDPSNILPATGCAALPDTVRLTKHALAKGCSNALIMPPFFFKDLSEDNVFALFAKIIDEVSDPALRVYLYNFPAVTGVLISPDVIGRLVEAYPDTIAGVKDSSGDWDYVTEIRQRFPHLALFTGWEALVPKLLAAGGAGNISGIANVAPDVLREVFNQADGGDVTKVLSGVEKLVETVVSYPITPALKALAADQQNKPGWRNLRVPYQPLGKEQEEALFSSVAQARALAGF